MHQVAIIQLAALQNMVLACRNTFQKVSEFFEKNWHVEDFFKFGKYQNFKLDFLATSIGKIEILTPLYLGNRGIKWGGR